MLLRNKIDELERVPPHSHRQIIMRRELEKYHCRLFVEYFHYITTIFGHRPLATHTNYDYDHGDDEENNENNDNDDDRKRYDGRWSDACLLCLYFPFIHLVQPKEPHNTTINLEE